MEWIVNLLGYGQNEFDVHTNTKITPVGKPLLNKDLESKPHKKEWKYCTAIGMLTYLQGNTCPAISMATHQLAWFCQVQGLVMNKQPHVLADILHTLTKETLSINPVNLWHRMLCWCRLCRWLEYSNLCWCRWCYVMHWFCNNLCKLSYILG